jgi:hypothetical protein
MNEKDKEAAWKDFIWQNQGFLCDPTSFNSGYDRGFQDAQSKWVRIEGPESLPKDANEDFWITFVNPEDVRYTDVAFYEPNIGCWFWANETDRDHDRIAVPWQVLAYKPYELPAPFTE